MLKVVRFASDKSRFDFLDERQLVTADSILFQPFESTVSGFFIDKCPRNIRRLFVMATVAECI